MAANNSSESPTETGNPAWRRFLPDLFSVLSVTAMVATSQLLGEREVIFPEIAAIAAGALLAPRFTWMTSKRRIFLYIALCATLGMAIVLFVPLGLPAKMAVAYAIGQCILYASGTGFAPMISAIVLPVLLDTRTPLYLASAFGFTGLILLLRLLLEKVGVRPRETFRPSRVPARLLAKRVVVGAVLVLLVEGLGFRFVAAPPLLVAFTEFTNPAAPPRRHPAKAIMLVTLSAVIGWGFRLFFTMQLGLPLWLGALLGMVLVIALLRGTGMFLPPAAALMLLAMLVPDAAVPTYPVWVAAGACLFMAVACLLFRE